MSGIDVLIIRGHQARAPGAFSQRLKERLNIRGHEFDFYSIVCPKIVDKLKARGVHAVYEQYRGSGNVARWARMQAKLIVEFHFNAAGSPLVDGCLTLYGENRGHMKTVAAAFNRVVAERLDTKPRTFGRFADGACAVGPGVPKYGGKRDRNGFGGGYLVRAVDAIIPEPFFGTNADSVDCLLAVDYVDMLADAAVAALEAKGVAVAPELRQAGPEPIEPPPGYVEDLTGKRVRETLDVSRTMKDADKGQITAGVTVATGAVGGVTTLFKAVPPWAAGIGLIAVLAAVGFAAWYYFARIKRHRTEDFAEGRR